MKWFKERMKFMATTPFCHSLLLQLCLGAAFIGSSLLGLEATGGNPILTRKPAYLNATTTFLQPTPEWQPQTSGTSEVLLGVAFTDPTHGYAVGTNGTIRTTSNGGNTWSPQASGTSRFLRDVYFSDATHGTIVGESGLILRTTNGTTWTPQTSGTTQHLVHVHFLNNSVGMASGQGGVILKTTDGGDNWSTQTSGTGVEIPGVFLIDDNTAVAVGFGGTILRTTNGGSSWTNISVPGFSSDLRSVHFFGSIGVAVSIGGGILRSTNAGQSWTPVSSGTANSLFAVQFRDANTVYAVGTATIRVSHDAGSTWSASTSTGFGSDLYSLVFNGTKGWAVGQFGLILNTENPTTVQLSAGSYSANENSGSLSVTIQRSNDTSGVVSINYATTDSAGSNNCNVLNSGAANSRCDYEATAGTVTFAVGETSKTILIPLIDDVYAEGGESLTITLSNPGGASLGSPAVATVNITDNDSVNGTNPIDIASFFVRLHYLDFFSREPDSGGLAFWTDQITSCGSDPICREVRRINVSAAFYLSIEFQETGFLVERMYKVAYGNGTGTSTLDGTHQLSVPIVRLNEFLPDTQEIGRGVVVGQTGWEAVLESNKRAFAGSFVQRTRFRTAFPSNLTPAAFVDALNINSGNALSTAERNQLVSDLTSGAKTRADVLRAVADDSDLRSSETNSAFVLMEYFGYLRRNPNDAPDADHTGYDFWLRKLNTFNGNFVNAEMVKAFIASSEYKERVGP
jgi:photosystem II stability/assembly factor-like uncharacterized protein